ncbi:MAG: hypothetical protein CSB46_08495 [Micrococcales bacterium]|nr:MAG: hypothetical protein CSB46_08495 [Micrococcales bacterium]
MWSTSIGFAITEKLRESIDVLPPQVWTPALDADGQTPEVADVAEITALLDPQLLAAWPDGMRTIVALRT